MHSAGRDTDPFIDRSHDHDRCVADAMETAVSLCDRRGVRLTPLRRRVLELVWQSHSPIGAYEVLEMLREDRRGAAPPTVYRALDFLREQGLVHRVDSLNAYVGCVTPDAGHRAHFLLCTECGQAAEIDDEALRDAIGRCAERAGFRIAGETVEITGICAACRH
ncbi:MAG: Fur family transcriptional regulator [Rhodospirillaceae bacterium]|nr:Fur family transcriptional regulator [Rhodospirillaceae bacterium]|tara:strand:- start:627 stop:1118 length:492 start_codon:yes stop_codon:yes gene_type:complete